MQEERRKHKRFDLEYIVQMVSDDGGIVVTSMTTNISDGGLRVPLPAGCLPDPGTVVQIHLTLRRKDNDEIQTHAARGSVIRHQQGADSETLGEDIEELAVQFTEPIELELEREIVLDPASEPEDTLQPGTQPRPCPNE